MSAAFDAFGIARDIDILDLITNKYGIETEKRHRIEFARCPRAGEGDTTPSLAVYVDQNRFHCYHCGDWHGTTIDFVMGMENTSSSYTALKKLDEFYPDLGIINPEGRKRADAAASYFNYMDKLRREDHARLKASKSYMKWVRERRGFSELAVDHFQLGVRDFNGVPRLMIPQFGQQNSVLNFVSRQMSPLDTGGRYFVKNLSVHPETGMIIKSEDNFDYAKYPLGPIHVFKKGEYLYNLDRVKSHDVILVEGHLDVIAGWEMGVENMVACGTSVITDAQAELLADYESVILIPDLDMLHKVIDNVAVIRLLNPGMPVNIVDLRCIDIEKDVNDALIFLSEHDDTDMFISMVKNAVPVEEWLYGNYVATAESRAKAFKELQKILDVSTMSVARASLVTEAGRDLEIPPDLLFK